MPRKIKLPSFSFAIEIDEDKLEIILHCTEKDRSFPPEPWSIAASFPPEVVARLRSDENARLRLLSRVAESAGNDLSNLMRDTALASLSATILRALARQKLVSPNQVNEAAEVLKKRYARTLKDRAGIRRQGQPGLSISRRDIYKALDEMYVQGFEVNQLNVAEHLECSHTTLRGSVKAAGFENWKALLKDYHNRRKE
jgi:hypothetical protein